MDQDFMPTGGKTEPTLAHVSEGYPGLLRALFWAELRRQAGRLRFCRNYSTGNYVHDFYCLNARFAVSIVTGPSDSVRELQRRQWLEHANIDAMQLSAADVASNAQLAAKRAVARACSRLPQDHPAFSA